MHEPPRTTVNARPVPALRPSLRHMGGHVARRFAANRALSLTLLLALSACVRNVQTGSRCPTGETSCTAEEPQPAGDDAFSAGTGAEAAGQGGMSRPVGGALCIENASIEGVAFLGNPAGWTSCKGTPDVSPAIAGLAASNGATYLAMIASDSDLTAESTQPTLCAPLTAGTQVALEIDLTLSAVFGPFGAAVLQIWGARSPCTPDELLWSSPAVRQFDAWQTYCATLTPADSYPYLMFVPTPEIAGANGGYLLLDNLRPAENCQQ